jgi:hypothetical protein
MSLDFLDHECKKTVFCGRCDLGHGFRYVDNVVNQILSLNNMCKVILRKVFPVYQCVAEFAYLFRTPLVSNKSF